jgi:hypothetical protein
VTPAGGRFGGDPVGGDPVIGDPVGGDSVGGDSVIGDPVGGDSVGGDSVIGDSVIGDLVEVALVDTVVRLDGRGGRLDELVLTGDVARSLSAVLQKAAARAGAGFFVVGAFGSGKSHFLAATGELLAQPAGAGRLVGWDRRLRELAAGCRRHLVVPVPLVEYRSDAVLEDVVAARAWDVLDSPARPGGVDRVASWDGVLDAAHDRGQTGLLVLLDELSEFLRAKQGPALTEDLRFLQFLGEWARGRPVIVLCALQESIEEVANVSQRELARIRDRYEPSLTLTVRHVEDVVRGRLVRLRPGAQEWIDRAHSEVQAAFPGWAVSLDRFRRCYPVHPQTLDVLEGLRFLFSQQRGVVDFICRQLAGGPDDTAGSSPPWTHRGYRDLVTPDRVYDHFRGRLHERVETSRLADDVVPHYERAVGEMFDNAADRELAVRVVKLLCLLAASPLERPRTAGELAGMLLAEVSGLDPQANVDYLELAVLGPLVDRGAYVVATGEAPPRYTVALQADASVVAQARLTQARAEFAPGDRRLIDTLVELGSTPVLPLQLLGELGMSRRELLWQNTLRSLLVGTVRLPELTVDDAANLVAQARAAGAEACLLVAEPEIATEREDADLAEHARRLTTVGRLAIWVPSALDSRTQDVLLDIHARRDVLERARAEGVGGLVEYLERASEADAARAREALRHSYFGGQVGYPDRAAAVDLPSLAGLPFERQLPGLAEPLLAGLHPRHREVAPRGQLVGDRLLRQLVDDVLSHGRIGAAAAGRLRPLVEGYLVPLGLVRRQRDAVVVAPDPARSPAVAEVLRLIGDADPVPARELVGALADGAVGLTEPEALLVLNACVQAGLVEAWRGRRRLAETFVAVTTADRFGVGELVDPALRSTVASLAPLTGPGPFEPWTMAVQRAAWDHARSWLDARREDLVQVRTGLDRLAELPHFADAATGPVADDLDHLGSVVAGCDTAAPPSAGLRQLSVCVDDPAELLMVAQRLGAVARFLREGLDRVAQTVDYLTHPELTIPTEHAGLATLRDEALDRARDVMALAAADRVGVISAAYREFRSAYLATYQEAHQRFYTAVTSPDLEELRESTAYRALERLAAIDAIAVPDDRVKVDRALAAAMPAPCRRPLDLELGWKPRCGCGLALGQEPPTLDREAILTIARRGIQEHLAELARPEHRTRLEAAAADLASLGRTELAGELRSLVALLAAPDAVDPTAVVHLLGDDLRSVLHDVLSGSPLVVQRDLAALREDLIGRRYPKRRLLDLLASWVDPLDELPPAGFIEIIDSWDAADGWNAARSSAAGSSAAGGSAAGGSAAGGSAASGSGTAGSFDAAAGGGAVHSWDRPATRPRPVARARGTGEPRSITAACLTQRFPGLAEMLPAQRSADAFWLAAWWTHRPSPPAWLPPRLLAERQLLAVATSAALRDLGALAELAELDARVGADSMLGDQVAAALDLGGQPVPEVAAVLVGERLLRHPVRLAIQEIVRRFAADFTLADRLAGMDLTELAAAHALVSADELAPFGHLLEAAGHLGAVERQFGSQSCRTLVEELWPEHGAPVAALVSRADLAAARGSLVDPDLIQAFRAGAGRTVAAMDTAFRREAEEGFPGCMTITEVGRAVLAPLLDAHGRVGVLLVDAMRVDLWRLVCDRLAKAQPARPVRQLWAVVPEPTRTAEAVAGLYLGRTIPAGSAPADATEMPFAHLGYQAAAVVAADRDHRAGQLRALWADGPPISVAVATGVDERLHRTSVELAALLDDAVTGLERRVLPSLAALPDAVPLIVLADHGFRENPAWGHGPEGRYTHGGLSLEESVVPVGIFGAVPRS